MKLRLPNWKWLAAGIAGVLIALVLVLALLMSWLNSDAGRDRIQFLADAALRDKGISVNIQGWSGRLPFGADVQTVELSDRDGVALRISDFQARWQLLPLLWGDIRIDLLQAESVLLERRPGLARDSDSEGSVRTLAIPHFLRNTKVSRIAIDRLEVGEAMLGQRAVWRVEGQIGIPGGNDLESYLEVSRIDGRSDHFLAKARYRPADNSLGLEASWEEAPGGAFSSLIVPESDEGIEVRVFGDGPLADWRGQLSGRAAGGSADLSIRLEEGDESRLDIHGQIDAMAILPTRFSALGRGTLDLSVTARDREDYRVIRVPNVRYATADLTLMVRGSLDQRDGSVASTVRLEQTGSGDVRKLMAPVWADGLDLTVTVGGSLDAPRLDGAIQADRVAVAGVDAAGVEATISLIPDMHAQQPFQNLGIKAELETREVSWSLKGMEKLIRGPARAILSGEADGMDRVLLSSVLVEVPDAQVSGTVDLDMKGRTMTAPLQVLVTDLDALDPLTRLDIEGAANLDVDLALPGFDGRVNIGVAARTRDFSLSLPVVRSIVSPDMELAASLDISPETGLNISGIRIAGQRATVTGSVTFPADYDRMEVIADGRLPDASVLSSELKVGLFGAAEVHARLSGPTRNPGVDGTLTVGGVQLPVGRWEQIHGTYSLADLADGAHGHVGVKGGGPIGPTHVDAVLTVAGGATEIGEIRASGDGISASGYLRIPHSGTPLTGSVHTHVEDLGPAAAGFLGWDGSGQGSASLAFDDAAGEQEVQLSLVADTLHLLISPDRPVSADKLNLRADLNSSSGVVNARMTAENFSGPSTRFPELKASAKGTMSDIGIEIETGGRVLGASATILAGMEIGFGESRSYVTLTRFEGSLADLPVHSGSGRPATLLVADGRIELSDLDLTLGEGQIRARARLGVPGAVADATITGLPLELLKLINPAFSLTGTLDAAVDLRTGSSGTEGTFKLALDRVLPSYRRRMVPMTGSLHGRLSSGRFIFEASAAASPQAPVTITGELPLEIDLVAVRAGLKQSGRLRGHLDWTGDALDLISLLPLENHLVRGPLAVELDVSGTVADPRVSGRAALEGGRYEHLLAGTVLSPLDVVIEGDGESLRLVGLNGGDGGAGTLTGSGSLSLDPKTGFPLKADLEFENLTLLRRDEITGRATGELRASGPLGNLEISGQVRTNEVEVALVNNLPPEVVDLEITEADSSGWSGTAGSGNGGKGTGMVDGSLDIDINMPRRVYLRGLGLDSEWRGDLNVRGTLGRPEIVGRLESIRGVLLFFGRRFRIESSSLAFTGGRKIDPELDIRSVHEGRELTVNLLLTGPISNPDLSLSSNPPLPEDEILARALFGKSAGQLTAVEAVQLAAAVGELTTRSSGPGVLARLREAVGVDVLRFGSVETAEGEQATTFEAGRYFTEGLYVGVETSTVEEGGGVTVEYEVSRRLRLTTDLKQTGGQNIGVEYKKDY